MFIIKFIKNNWKDPVWSKVFAAGIIAAIGSFGLYVYSLIEKIPFQKFWNESLIFLKENSIRINYLTVLIIIFSLLVVIVPMILMKVISIQLKNIKIPSNLKTPDFDLESFVNGAWKCSYTKVSSGWKGGEIVEIREGNKYYLNNKLYFVLTNIEADVKNNTISWTKTTYPGNSKHSRETLKITNGELMDGQDDTGFLINYSKQF